MDNDAEKRLSEVDARKAIESWLRVEAPGSEGVYHLCEDGEVCWAFWVYPEDTTSYVHPDGKIEWLGTD